MNERISKVFVSETDKKYYETIKTLLGRDNMWLVDNLIYKSYLMGGIDELKEANKYFKSKETLQENN